MEYEQLNITVEELEKRLKFIKKDEVSNINTINTKINSLETATENLTGTCDSISNDLSSIRSSVTTNTNNISTLSSNVSTNTNNISSLQTSVANASSSISTLESIASSNSSNISIMQSNISSLQTNINTLQTDVSSNADDIEDLDARVEAIEASGGGSSQTSTETYNCFNVKNFPINLDTFGAYENFFTCFFLCDTSSYVKIKMQLSIEINNNEERTKTLNVYLNDEIIDTRSYTVNGTLSDSYTVEYTFMPLQEHNNILFKTTETASSKRYCRVKLVDCKIEFFGRNIEILNRENDFKVFLSRNKYYITKNSGSTAEYKIFNFGESDITTNYLPVPRPVYNYDDAAATSADKYTYTYFNYQIIPIITYNTSTNLFEINDSDIYVVGVSNNGYNVNKALLSSIPLHANNMTKLSYSAEYSLSSPGAKISNGEFVVDTLASNSYCTKDRGTYYLIFTNSVTNSATTPIYTMSYNGSAIPGKWVHNEAVFAKDWETTPNRPYACIATNEKGENYFYPEREATYRVYIGKGSQTSAYMQSDGSINVYISYANKIYKHVLTFNSQTNQYELTSSNYLMDGKQYLEGYSNDYFYKKGETWTYVSPVN